MKNLNNIPEVYKMKRKMIGPLNKVANQGGFFETYMEKEISKCFDTEVIELRNKFYPYGDNAYDYCLDIEKAIVQGENFVINKTRELNPRDPEIVKLKNWTDETSAKVLATAYRGREEKAGTASERVESIKKASDMRHSFWENYDISEIAAETLDDLSLVEKTVLGLCRAKLAGHNYTTSEIAEMPEFSCKEKYIEMVLESVDEQIEFYPDNVLELWDYGLCRPKAQGLFI